MPPNLSLKVFDCYRPERAIADFLAWADNPKDQRTKPDYYPTVDKSRLFDLGYLSRSSAHSRGTAVDVAIVDLSVANPTQAQPSGECFRPYRQRRRDSTLDFGTSYDCFHPFSATAHYGISAEARKNRDFLVREMQSVGFENYHREWWHFDYRQEPARATFDIPIRSSSKQDTRPAQRNAPDLVNASAPQFGSKAFCGEDVRVRLVCVPTGDRVPGYASPSSTSRPIAQFSRSAHAVLECRRCLGDLAEYASLDTVARLTARVPWCLVEQMNEDGAGSQIGWVSARNLVPSAITSFDCAH
jgi:D-alanyl-D-alanine dipeptidase